MSEIREHHAISGSMKISVIAAVDVNGLIAVDDTLPWHCPEDLKHFYRTTKGKGNNTVIMGRKTFESLENTLSGRLNIIVSPSMFGRTTVSDALVVQSLDAALEAARLWGCEEAFIIGGHNMFAESLKIADTLYLTMVNLDCLNRSARTHTYFPRFAALLLLIREFPEAASGPVLFDDPLYVFLEINLKLLRDLAGK